MRRSRPSRASSAFRATTGVATLIYLALQEASRRWRHINGWNDAMNHLAIAFEERIAAALR